MAGHQGDVLLPLSRAEAQELLARLLLSHDDDNDLSASLMKRLARALDPERTPLEMVPLAAAANG